MIIDAHLHLWEKQNGIVNDKPVIHIEGGCSDFGGEVRQMMPPDMKDGINSIEGLIANMNYAQVNGAVVTQEYIDGNQDNYLLQCKEKYPNRIKICSLYEEKANYNLDHFDGIKICGGRLKKVSLTDLLPVCKDAEEKGKFLSIDLAPGDKQIPEMKELIKACPTLKISIGHFGMVTVENWQKQIELACYPNVYIESGGITWLYHKEFYPYPSAIDAILEAKSICGIDKLMWGSDYPRTMTAITYRMSQDFVSKSPKLTVDEKKKFLGETARNFYGFEYMEDLPYIKNMVED